MCCKLYSVVDRFVRERSTYLLRVVCGCMRITLLFTFIFVIPWRGLDILYWEVGAIAVFFGWFTVAVFLQTFEVVGIFVTVMFKVTRNVIGVLLITIVMIFAFAFPLYILVGTVPDLTFTTIGMSLISILASLNGEIDYDTFVRLELLEGFPYTLLTLVCVLTIIMPIYSGDQPTYWHGCWRHC